MSLASSEEYLLKYYSKLTPQQRKETIKALDTIFITSVRQKRKEILTPTEFTECISSNHIDFPYLHGLSSNPEYIKDDKFNCSNIGLRYFHDGKFGMLLCCPYCPIYYEGESGAKEHTGKFFNFETGEYANHLASNHGIFIDNGNVHEAEVPFNGVVKNPHAGEFCIICPYHHPDCENKPCLMKCALAGPSDGAEHIFGEYFQHIKNVHIDHTGEFDSTRRYDSSTEAFVPFNLPHFLIVYKFSRAQAKFDTKYDDITVSSNEKLCYRTWDIFPKINFFNKESSAPKDHVKFSSEVQTSTKKVSFDSYFNSLPAEQRRPRLRPISVSELLITRRYDDSDNASYMSDDEPGFTDDELDDTADDEIEIMSENEENDEELAFMYNYTY